jgi:hypothetical protein
VKGNADKKKILQAIRIRIPLIPGTGAIL